MDPTDELAGLVRLGYDPQWLQAGILTRSTLQRQLKEIARPDGDPSTEHYRLATLRDFLGARERLTDAEIQAVHDLGALDPDPSIRTCYSHELIRFSGLTDQQFETLAGRDVDAAFVRVVVRLRILRRLAAGAPLASVFDEAIASADGQLHRALLDHPELTRAQAEVLAARGGNRAIKNRARQRAQRRRR